MGWNGMGMEWSGVEYMRAGSVGWWGFGCGVWGLGREDGVGGVVCE